MGILWETAKKCRSNAIPTADAPVKEILLPNVRADWPRMPRFL